MDIKWLKALLNLMTVSTNYLDSNSSVKQKLNPTYVTVSPACIKGKVGGSCAISVT